MLIQLKNHSEQSIHSDPSYRLEGKLKNKGSGGNVLLYE